MTTNGHPTLASFPLTPQEPKVIPPTRHLVIEVRDGGDRDIILESIDVTDGAEIEEQMAELGWVRVGSASWPSVPNVTTEDAFLAGTNQDQAMGKLPSERLIELSKDVVHRMPDVAQRCGWQVAVVAEYLDERLGRKEPI